MKKIIFGKAILSGEHAVIRGAPAIVVPVKSKNLEMEYFNSDLEFDATFSGEMSDDLSIVFWGVLEKSLKILEKKHSDLRGRLVLKNSVPVGAGLGASATLCAAMGRFFENLGWIHQDKIYEFCRQLENIFHGESSGVDIASVLMEEPIVFKRPCQIERLEVSWKPRLYLSYSGQRGMTSECVRRVKALWERDAHFANQIDEDMKKSVMMFRQALGLNNSESLFLLIEAMNKARSCFERWGLTEGVLDEHMKSLLGLGALSTKPTGSGRGGYVLSLWKNELPLDPTNLMIPIEF